jgi:hypothetical protein
MDNDSTEFVDAALRAIEIAEEGVYFLDSSPQAPEGLFQPKFH